MKNTVHDGVVIWKLAPRSSFVCIFCFVSPEVKTSPNLFCPIPLPFTCSRWRFFLALSPAPFSIVLCHPTPNSRPKEFRLVFASLAAAAPLDGQPHRRRLFQFLFVCSCCPLTEFHCVFSASFIRSHRFVLFVIYCIFAENTIQCSDCCRVGRQNLCSSFLSNNTITSDRKGLHHDLKIFQARCLGRFFGISSTPKQLVTCSEFSLIIIVKQSIFHWFNIKNTITCDRKGLHHDLEIFHARCLVRFLVSLQHQWSLSHVMSFLL
jgi:hypothetical protein